MSNPPISHIVFPGKFFHTNTTFPQFVLYYSQYEPPRNAIAANSHKGGGKMTKLEITVLAMALKKLIKANDIKGVEEILDTILEDAKSSAAEQNK